MAMAIRLPELLGADGFDGNRRGERRIHTTRKAEQHSVESALRDVVSGAEHECFPDFGFGREVIGGDCPIIASRSIKTKSSSNDRPRAMSSPARRMHNFVRRTRDHRFRPLDSHRAGGCDA